MSFGPDQAKLLNLWQRLQFKSDSDGSSPSERADAVRARLLQLQHLQRSVELSSVGYSSLMREYANKYSVTVDEQDNSKGLNNFAEPVLALVSGQKNESQMWKSRLSLESLRSTALWQKLVEKAQSTEPVPSVRTTPVTTDGVFRANKNIEQASISALERNDKRPIDTIPSWQSARTSSEKRHGAQQSHSKAQFVPGKSLACGDLQSNSREEESVKVTNKRKAFSLYPKASSYQEAPRDEDQRLCMNPSKNPRVMPTYYGGSVTDTSQPAFNSRQPGQKLFGNNYNTHKKNNIDDNDKEEEATAPQSFITAKQQYLLDCKTKKQRGGRGVGRGGPGGGGYGASSRKTLGARRGPSSQFVPPMLSRDADDSGQERGTYGGLSAKKGESNNNKPMESITGDPELDEKLKNIEPKMVELIMSEIMDHGPPVNWDDIAGLQFAKNVIKEIVVWPMLRPDIFKGLRGPPKGLLLFGPPGTGKTLIGKCIASQSKATFFSISASSLTSKWVGEGEKMVRALFSVARCHLPAVIFIDEIDSLLTQRTDGEHDASRRIKTEFLVQLDGAATTSDERLLVVGATNRPQEIDEAARRRLVKRLYIPLPEAPARGQIIRNLLSQQTYSLADDETDKIVQRTDGYSGADMSNLCREAALGPIRSLGTSDIQSITAEQVRPILFCDFDAALSQVRASVSQQDLQVYTEWNRLFGSGSK